MNKLVTCILDELQKDEINIIVRELYGDIKKEDMFDPNYFFKLQNELLSKTEDEQRKFAAYMPIYNIIYKFNAYKLPGHVEILEKFQIIFGNDPIFGENSILNIGVKRENFTSN